VGGIDDLRQLAALDHFFKTIHGNLPNAAHQENSKRVMQPFSFGSASRPHLALENIGMRSSVDAYSEGDGGAPVAASNNAHFVLHQRWLNVVGQTQSVLPSFCLDPC